MAAEYDFLFDDASESSGFDPSNGVEGYGEGDPDTGVEPATGPMADDMAVALVQGLKDRQEARERDAREHEAKVQRVLNPHDGPLFGFDPASATGIERIAAAIASSPEATAMLAELREVAADLKAKGVGASTALLGDEEAEPVDNEFAVMPSEVIAALADTVTGKRAANAPAPGYSLGEWRALLRRNGWDPR